MKHFDGIGSQTIKRKKIFQGSSTKLKKLNPTHKIFRNVDGISFENEKIDNSKKSFYKSVNLSFFGKATKRALAYFLLVVILSTITIPLAYSQSVQEKIDLVRLFKSGRYLVLFQNNAELRATGGFIGSFGVVDIKYGKIADYYIDGNIYKRDDKYNYMLQVKAPEPLQTFIGEGKYWSMHDANWWVDYPQSAQQVAWFYQKEGGEKVDGVIAITASLIQDLLQITGPISLDQYGKTLTADNFFDTLHFYIEKEYPNSPEKLTVDEPKGIIRDFAPILMEKISQSELRGQLLGLARQALEEKQAILYFNNSDLENLVLGQNWGGAVKETTGDYLYVNNSNLGGYKSSLNVLENLRLHSQIDSQGEITNTLVITRTHTGDGQWPDNENKNYMRVLVPEGSKLISGKLDEIEITNQIAVNSEAGKTSYGVWFTTPVGQSKVLEVNYQLPFQLKHPKYYSLYLQKQPGALGEKVEVIINNQVLFNDELKSDQEISL